MIQYTIKFTTQFKKDYKLAMRRGLDIKKLDTVIQKLASAIPLGPEYHDHSLGGKWIGHRECHIEPDWLLITIFKVIQ